MRKTKEEKMIDEMQEKIDFMTKEFDRQSVENGQLKDELNYATLRNNEKDQKIESLEADVAQLMSINIRMQTPSIEEMIVSSVAHLEANPIETSAFILQQINSRFINKVNKVASNHSLYLSQADNALKIANLKP